MKISNGATILAFTVSLACMVTACGNGASSAGSSASSGGAVTPVAATTTPPCDARLIVSSTDPLVFARRPEAVVFRGTVTAILGPGPTGDLSATTNYSVRVDRVIKGNPAHTVTVNQFGERRGSQHCLANGDPLLEPGQVALFVLLPVPGADNTYAQYIPWGSNRRIPAADLKGLPQREPVIVTQMINALK